MPRYGDDDIINDQLRGSVAVVSGDGLRNRSKETKRSDEDDVDSEEPVAVTEDAVDEQAAPSRAWKFAEWVLNTALFAAIMFTYGFTTSLFNYSFPLTFEMVNATAYTTDGEMHNYIHHTTKDGASFQAGLALAFVPFASWIGNSIELIMWKKWRGQSIRDRRSTVRWICDSIANPLLTIIVFMPYDVLDVFSVVALFLLVHVATVFGLVMETTNAPKLTDTEKGPKVTTYPMLFILWIRLLAIIPFVTTLSTTTDSTHTVLEWFAFATYIIYIAYDFIVQTGYYMYLGNTTSGCTWPYHRSYKRKGNFQRYDALMGFGSSLMRGIVMLLTMFVALSFKHYVTPRRHVAQHSYNSCGDNAGAYFSPECEFPHGPMTTVSFPLGSNPAVGNFGRYVTLPVCDQNNPSSVVARRASQKASRPRRMTSANGVETSLGSELWAAQLQKYWVDNHFHIDDTLVEPTFPCSARKAYCNLPSLTTTVIEHCTSGMLDIPAYWSYMSLEQHPGTDESFGILHLAGQASVAYNVPGDQQEAVGSPSNSPQPVPPPPNDD